MKLISKKLKKKIKGHIQALPKTVAIMSAAAKIFAVLYLMVRRMAGC